MKRAVKIIFVILVVFTLASIHFYLQDINKEVLPKSRKSAFYGMIHMDTYGFPITFYKNKSFEIKKEDWRVYFPQLVVALKMLMSLNPTVNSTLSTHSYTITLQKNNFIVGKMFYALITSLDKTGKAKTFGGDYYRARLIRDRQYFLDGIPCQVIDNDNGTYTVKALLLLQASLTLEVKLVISVEGIYDIIQQTEKLVHCEYDYIATLRSFETTTCNVNFLNTSK